MFSACISQLEFSKIKFVKKQNWEDRSCGSVISRMKHLEDFPTTSRNRKKNPLFGAKIFLHLSSSFLGPYTLEALQVPLELHLLQPAPVLLHNLFVKNEYCWPSGPKSDGISLSSLS